MFRDVTTLLKNGAALRHAVKKFAEYYKGKKVDVVVGPESRGFIFGTALAYELGVGFVPVRKPGKLPGKTVSKEYELEYGTDKVEIHEDAIKPGQNVVIIDDLIATAGTCMAVTDLVEELGGNIVGCGFVVELPDLHGREKLQSKGYDVFSLVEFEGD